ncbi:C2 domain-containing protein [Aureococcus anophagefferens]|nr:C2 domain-containing protein [Aureococcus anophagefferens]
MRPDSPRKSLSSPDLGARGRPPPKRQPSTPTGVGLAGQRQPSQAAKKPSVLRSVSAKLRRPLGNVPPIGSEHYLEKVHTQTAVRAVDLSLLLISMKNQRNAEVDEHGEHSISEKATATNEPLDVWLKLWHVSHGRLRVKIIYRDFENTLANNLPMGEDLKRRSRAPSPRSRPARPR